jgi:hypothetical protein
LTSCPPTPAKTAVSGGKLKRHPSCSSITEEDITDEEDNAKIEFPWAILTGHASRSFITEEDITEEGPTKIELSRARHVSYSSITEEDISIKGDEELRPPTPTVDANPDGRGHKVQLGHSVTRESSEEIERYSSPIDMIPNRWEGYYEHWQALLKGQAL